MRDQLVIQEEMDCHLNSRDEELRQLHSQSQEDGAQLSALSLQVQELIAPVKERSKVVEKDLEEVNGHFDHHQGEINCLKVREKEAKEKVNQLGGFIIGAGHDAKILKDRLDCMEENLCQCSNTPSEVGEEFVSSDDEARTELSYASARGSEYIAPPVENPIPIPVPVPCHPCGSSFTAPVLEEIVEEPAGAICKDLDALLREADVERVRDLQEESSNSVVHSSP